jgi:hypothetical protein
MAHIFAARLRGRTRRRVQAASRCRLPFAVLLGLALLRLVLQRVGGHGVCAARAGCADGVQGSGGILIFGGCGYDSAMDGSTGKAAGVSEIYFKKLTQDLLEVCRMLDDKPEIKNRLSEITVDISFLPDVGYAFDKWTTDPPKEDGDYFAWKRDDEYFDTPTIVSVTNIRHISEPPYFTFWFAGVEYELSRVTHWLGPLPVPDPPK